MVLKAAQIGGFVKGYDDKLVLLKGAASSATQTVLQRNFDMSVLPRQIGGTSAVGATSSTSSSIMRLIHILTLRKILEATKEIPT